MTRLIMDGNSILNEALLGGIDHDQGKTVEHEGKQIQVNSAQYGVDRFFDKFGEYLKEFSAAPRQVILVWDGRNAKLRRRTFLPQYKVGRDKAPAISEQINIARDQVSEMVLKLGAHIAQQGGLEGDDVIGYLCKVLRTQHNVVITGDGDMCVLVDSNTSVWRRGELNKNPYGPFPHKYTTLYKALVGDNGDKIPGAKGFGDAKWVELVRTFGLDGLELMEDLVKNDQLHKLREDLDSMPNLKLLIESKDTVALSWRAASLMVDEVNTMHKPLAWRVGMTAQWNELDDSMRVHELRHFYGTKTLVTAANYEKAKAAVAARMAESPFVALDIETSSSEESDEWIERLNTISEKSRGDKIDVLGHELTGMSLTFGANTQHTIYMSVDHADTDNITVDQCREMVEVIPQSKHIIIQNRQFEFSVLYRTWGEKWMGNGWHGFVPNALDSKVGANYIEENLPNGLKFRSKHHLDYDQETYEQVTTISGLSGTLRGGVLKKVYEKEIVPAVYERVTDEDGVAVNGKLLTPAVTEPYEDRQYKMRELTAARVFNYGADDTITTAALHSHYQMIMELEGTWQTYLDVETLPEYLTSLAFVQGVPVSLGTLKSLEVRDDATYDAAWAVLQDYLLKHEWEGTVCPVIAEMTPAAVKEAVALLVDTDVVQFTTKKRKLDGMALDLRTQFPDNAMAEIVALMVEKSDVAGLNRLVKQNFTGAPKINFSSNKQLQRLLYEVIGATPRLFNAMTQKQREENDAMREAFKKQRQEKSGKTVEYSAEERAALISKASTDDAAVDTALHLDDLDDTARAVLKGYQAIKSVQTRRSLFYRPYKHLLHWRDGRIHSSLNQCGTTTRRYSSSSPNLQQLPKLGEGGQFRGIILPHRTDAVVVSCDFAAQEIRVLAELSGDKALTSCYIGDNLRDMHSLTAVSAAPLVWGEPVAYETFISMLESHDPVVKAKAKALRAQSKTTFFAGAYGAMAPKIAQTLMVSEDVAQKFLDAKDQAFPGIEIWKRKVEAEAQESGYALTMLGARRHLRTQLSGEDKWDRAKGERQAGNFVIQGSSSEQTKLAMVEMWKRRLFTGKYDARFMAAIHDECVASVRVDQALEFIKEFHDCMQTPYAGMKIPNVSSISVGPNFGHQLEVGDHFDEAIITKALEGMSGGPHAAA